MRSCAAHSTIAVRWPFWLLLVAWVCAHSPQVVMPTVLTWLAKSRSLSHQRDLSRAAAFVLGGEREPGRVAEALAVVHASPHDAASQAPVSLPSTVVLKKIDLATERLSDVAPPAGRDALGARVEFDFRSRQRAQPPHAPPRVGNMI